MRTLLAYGDSNTHGTLPMADLLDVRRLGPAERWPGIAASRLAPEWRVVEEGLPGRTTVHPDPIAGVHKNGLAVLPAILETHQPIDLVVLMLGTNDLKARFGVPAVEIAVSVDKLLLAIGGSFAGPGGAAPPVLLVAPPPVSEAGCLAEVFAGGAAKGEGARPAPVRPGRPARRSFPRCRSGGRREPGRRRPFRRGGPCGARPRDRRGGAAVPALTFWP